MVRETFGRGFVFLLTNLIRHGKGKKKIFPVTMREQATEKSSNLPTVKTIVEGISEQALKLKLSGEVNGA